MQAKPSSSIGSCLTNSIKSTRPRLAVTSVSKYWTLMAIKSDYRCGISKGKTGLITVSVSYFAKELRELLWLQTSQIKHQSRQPLIGEINSYKVFRLPKTRSMMAFLFYLF